MSEDIGKSANRIYATLDVRRVRVPYNTQEEQDQADKTNAEIAHLGFQTFRAAYDWSYMPYEKMLINRTFSERQRRSYTPDPLPFKSGDLVRVFKTVSDGDVHWQGKVDYDREEYHHGYQKGMDKGEWIEMFYDRLPAKVTSKRSGRTFFGMLEPFAETGTEGTIWSVSEYGKEGYDALHCLEEGDELTVYSQVRDGDVEWEGPVSFGPEKITKVGWSEVLRETKHVATDKWLGWNWQRRPAVIVPK